ncbi:hypothetical protein BBP40_004647 [Aspergillus hancockii]|nr:hypothetical protein BBP40_004647 [Aspergillus hancockii]
MDTIQGRNPEQPFQNDIEDTFNPSTHLHYTPPTSLITMNDLGLKGSKTSTPIAGSVPFPFLSEEGVRAYRRSMIRQDILRRCAKQYGTGTFILRGLAKHSKFIRDLWTHPETMRIVSEVAGVPLAIIMPTEIGHTNIQATGHTVEDLIRELEVEPSGNFVGTDEQEDYDPLNANSVIPWQYVSVGDAFPVDVAGITDEGSYDSYPYVAVVMLSDTTHMVGGETYIRKGDGSAAKVEGPALGYCVILQGGQVEHLAARAFGASERITTITSYRAAVTGLYDDSYISNVRPYCDLPGLYAEWTSYRLEGMKQEIEHMQLNITKHMNKDPDAFPLDEIYHFSDQQMSYLKRTIRQMVDLTLCADIRRRFDAREINSVGETWARVRNHARFKKSLPEVMTQTMAWEPALPYINDWQETKHMIQFGHASSVLSQQGNFSWQQSKFNDYLFGDELLRQGLKEVLLAWLDRSDLIRLG